MKLKHLPIVVLTVVLTLIVAFVSTMLWYSLLGGCFSQDHPRSAALFPLGSVVLGLMVGTVLTLRRDYLRAIGTGLLVGWAVMAIPVIGYWEDPPIMQSECHGFAARTPKDPPLTWCDR